MEIMGEANYGKINDGWYFRVRCNDCGIIKDIRKQGFATRREAKFAYLELVSEMEKTNNVNTRLSLNKQIVYLEDNLKHATNEITLKELFIEYYDYSKNRLKTSSLRSVYDMINRFVLPYFGDRNIYTLKTNDIRNWQQEILKKKFAFKYNSKIHNAFSALINYGVKFHDLQSNVVTLVGNFRNQSKKTEMQVWDADEFVAVYNNVKDEPYKTLFLFMYLMGTRKGETLH